MKNTLRNFLSDETAAVTVDWVVLTGMIAGLGVVVCLVIARGATDKATGLGAVLETTSVADGSRFRD